MVGALLGRSGVGFATLDGALGSFLADIAVPSQLIGGHLVLELHRAVSHADAPFGFGDQTFGLEDALLLEDGGDSIGAFDIVTQVFRVQLTFNALDPTIDIDDKVEIFHDTPPVCCVEILLIQ